MSEEYPDPQWREDKLRARERRKNRLKFGRRHKRKKSNYELECEERYDATSKDKEKGGAKNLLLDYEKGRLDE